ncbi:acyl-CoA transferase [Dasania marina]|uniref:DsrE family protein n=1 Tax=Dasania marina TaxID=471499 RepID=UPI0030DD7F7F|tara:strand:+ start:37228 stop:37674 length:447 start_codon:yes stop_codon:yes gene_type:complete
MGLKPLVIAISFYCLSSLSLAQTSYAVADEPAYLARIELHTAAELYALLQRSEQLFMLSQQTQAVPVAFVLHGPEAEVFFRGQYSRHQNLVDLAAKLSAFNVVEIKVCKTWMAAHRLDEQQLLPFVGTVHLGPAEEQRLLNQQGYNYF